jgi:cytochrome d ubiquinol oxidase subunit II
VELLWFCVLAFLLTGYVLLDGYDLGTGVLHLFVARTDAERRQTLRTINSVWHGNEVWLLAAGGVLVLAFPVLYASSFSGFYLPLMMVLWLLIMRGVALHFRNDVPNALWGQLWDVCFAVASGLLALFFGVALGNVLRGLPLDANGGFFLPLWSDLRVSANAGVLDWYTTLVGLLTLLALAEHGALWLAYRTSGAVRERSAHLAKRIWPALAVMVVLVTFFTFRVQSQVPAYLAARPWGYLLPAIAVTGFILMIVWARAGRDDRAFAASALFIAGMLGSAAFGIYPYVLPAIGDPAQGLTIFNTTSSPHALTVALFWFIPGMLLAIAYTAFAHRKAAGRIAVEDES